MLHSHNMVGIVLSVLLSLSIPSYAATCGDFVVTSGNNSGTITPFTQDGPNITISQPLTCRSPNNCTLYNPGSIFTANRSLTFNDPLTVDSKTTKSLFSLIEDKTKLKFEDEKTEIGKEASFVLLNGQTAYVIFELGEECINGTFSTCDASSGLNTTTQVQACRPLVAGGCQKDSGYQCVQGTVSIQRTTEDAVANMTCPACDAYQKNTAGRNELRGGLVVAMAAIAAGFSLL